MSPKTIRLLLIEDSEGDAGLLEANLAEHAGGEFDVTWVERLDSALTRLRVEHFDVALCDLSLPDSNGLDTVRAISACAPALPFVVLTGLDNHGSDAIQLGAQDFLRKANLRGDLVVAALRYAIERKRINRNQERLGTLNGLIMHSHDRAELFSAACRIAVEHGGFGKAWIGRHVEESKAVTLTAWAGFDSEPLRGKPSEWVAPMELDLVARAVREPGLVLEAGLEMSGLLPGAASADQGSKAALALLEGDRVAHVMLFYSAGPGVFSADQRQWLDQFGPALVLALEHITVGERLCFLARFDPLTGLANRLHFEERLQQHLPTQAGAETAMAVMVFDLERMQDLNDSVGRDAGDELLRQFAQRLLGAAGNEELTGRLVADRFALMARGFADAGMLARHIETVILPLLAQPFTLRGQEMRLGVKLGVGLFPGDGASAAGLLGNAEAALHKAKQRGERYLFYSAKVNNLVTEMLALETNLRRALDREEFVLHYQPKLDMGTGKVVGLEALIRWNDPNTGLVPPGLFIPALERTGMIHAVGQWALRQAARDRRAWCDLGLSTRVAVNVSLLQLRSSDFVRQVTAVNGSNAGEAGLDLEITESLLMEDVDDSIGKLHELRGLGVGVAIDDFGTGYCSLSYLARLPVSALKIDRSFVLASTRDPAGLSLLATIIGLAHSFDFKVIAEGVDDEEQLKLLRLLRCDQWQGFLFSKAVPANEVANLLASGWPLARPSRLVPPTGIEPVSSA